MNVLSLFDGISCARVALERAGLTAERYFASEIDKYAIQVSKNNYQDIFHIGDITAVQGNKKEDSPQYLFVEDFNGITSHYTGGIDLLIGGSPCQDLSIAQKERKGLLGNRSGLFWQYVRLLKEIKPKYFLLENVASMSKEDKEAITKALGVEPIMIDASLVSAQRRKRLFWTNIQNIILPEDKNILLKDIVENYIVGDKLIEPEKNKNLPQSKRVYGIGGKSVTLSANGGGAGAKTGLYIMQTPRGFNKGGKRALDGKVPTLSKSSWEHNNHLVNNSIIRKLTPIECERLQGLPDGYTTGISDSQRYKCLGNAFNVDVIAHILSFIEL